jgi:endonuclease/exonuclease/phosphatase family metal-dependent hydrolase
MSRSPLVATYTHRVDRLSPVSLEQREHFLNLPPTPRAHDEAHALVAAMREIEMGGASAAPPPGRELRVAAWNLERCLYPDLAADLMRQHGVGLSLLTEMDCGMLRTGQAHTIARVAERLGQAYAYGLEFLELMPAPPPPGFAASGSYNQAGFHGNGLVSAQPVVRPTVIRLDPVADWFAQPKGGQRRIGNRMAVAAKIECTELRFLACSVHLESASAGDGRLAQMRTLLDAIDELAQDLPVLIGGDLNTRVPPGGHGAPSEPLFASAKARGYDFGACNVAAPTTRKSVWSDSEGIYQLDWLCTRGLAAGRPQVVRALGRNGQVLTDHDLLLVTIEV